MPESDPTIVAQPERLTTDQLLDSAATLFWHKGYAGTTTREIAAALGIQQASLYHHVASKEDLLYKICRSSIEQFLAEVPPAVEQAQSPEERVRILIQTHVEVLLRYQARNVTMLTELRAVARRRGAEMVALRDEYERFVRSTLAAAQAAGALRSDLEAKYLCLALLNMLNYAALWYRKDHGVAQDRLASMFVEVFLNGAAAAGAINPVRLAQFDGNEPAPGARIRRPRQTPRNRALEKALNAAVGLFSRQGYAATSTRQVAALVGIQKASLYYHISKKEDLLYLICTGTLERLRSDVEGAIAGIEDPLVRVQALISAHIESLLRDADKHSTTFSEMHSLSDERLTQVLALRSAYEGVVREVVEQAQDAGALRAGIDPKYLCRALLGMMNRTTVWFRRNGPLSPADVGRLLGSVFLNGVGKQAQQEQP